MSDDSVHIRNAKALAEGLKNEVAKRELLHGRVTALEQQVAMFRQAVTEMQQQMQSMRSARTSTGPTQR